MFHHRGYLSPEYASFGHVSTKVDVFSFGVLILEIISGRKNIDYHKPADQQILSEWVCSTSLALLFENSC
jgi:serine/threonine protein kinase